MNKKIWLIRHAESQANAGMKTEDPVGTQLSAFGFEQARKLAKALSESPGLIVTSPYIRTKQTAQPLIEKYHNIQNEEWDVQEFTYLSPVKYRNTTVLERKPMVEKYWQAGDPFYCDGEGAESFNDFINRAKNTISMLKKRDEKNIAVFSHGQFIAGVLWVMNNNKKAIDSKQMNAYKEFLESNLLDNSEFRVIKL